MSITSSKHSSGLHFISCRRTDKYKHMYKHSGMTIPTSGTHLSGQHRCGWSRWGWSRCGWAVWGRGKAINQGPSIKFDTCWRLFTTSNDFWHKRKMYNFDPYNVLLAIATNIPVLLMTAFVLLGHIFIYIPIYIFSVKYLLKYWMC